MHVLLKLHSGIASFRQGADCFACVFVVTVMVEDH